MRGGASPISSSRIVPPSACSKRPRRWGCRQEIDRAEAKRLHRGRNVGVAGVEDDGDLRVTERAEQPEAVHARHAHVAHDDADRSLVEDPQRLRAVRGLEDVRVETLEGART
jgi:hypothetical protein